MQSAEALYPEFATTRLMLLLAMVTILESIGPVVTGFALRRFCEVDADAALKP